MPGNSGLSVFTQEISRDGALARMMKEMPAEHLATALAGLEVDRGYVVRIADVRIFLAGLDVRFS